MSDSLKEGLLALLGRHNYMVLATIGPAGAPWAASLYFGVSGQFDIYFVSRFDAQHSQNIRADGRCSGAILDAHRPPETNDGLQFAGLAYELTDNDELKVAINALYDKRYPDPSIRATKHRTPADFQPPATRGLYRVVVDEWYKYDTPNRSEDRRVKIDLVPDTDVVTDQRPDHLK